MHPARPPSLPREGSLPPLQTSKKPSLASAASVPSFAQFRAQTSAVPSPVRRKPLPPDASPVATRFSSGSFSSPTKEAGGLRDGVQRSYSVDAASPPPFSRFKAVLAPPPLSATEEKFPPQNLNSGLHEKTPTAERPSLDFPQPATSLPTNGPSPKPLAQSKDDDAHRPRHEPTASISISVHDSKERGPEYHSESQTMYSQKLNRQNSNTQYDDLVGDYPEDGADRAPAVKRITPPSQKFKSFFNWRTRPVSESESPTTTFTDQSVSPGQSPKLNQDDRSFMPRAGAPSALDIPKANAMGNSSYFNVPGTPLLSTSPAMNAHVEELERELREISTELANSIQREMELEDEIDRLRVDLPAAPAEVNRRTSDYYSDSGASSVRYPFSDAGTKMDELDKARRKAEQDRAQIRADTANRVQEELRRRRDLEAQIQTLDEQLQTRNGSVSVEASGDRVQQLEATLEDVRRRHSEERKMKENFEDLLAALKQELQLHRDERDNLRDEVVPQLRAKLEGLEADSSEMRAMTYENARMQQEIQALKTEIKVLSGNRRSQTNSQHNDRFTSIAEEIDGSRSPTSPVVGLSRSNSLARNSTMNKRMSLSRSNSVKDRQENKDIYADRLKDVEEQRDALHIAVKSLLKRQAAQAKEHTKKVKLLEMERDHALNISPRRTAFHREVANLREEVDHLRRRADEAVDQKWQCEKGLGGLRMDLDRAEQETASLRELLKEHDVLVPERKLSFADGVRNGSTSVPLDKAFKELQATHALSLASIRDMEGGNAFGEPSPDTMRTMDLLRQSISDAETERAMAQKAAEEYRQTARDLQKSEVEHLGKQQTLAAELFASATRMDELSAKIQEQLIANKSLRGRLADAIARGEQDQRMSADKIAELERRLKSEEEKVMAAQQHSEEAIARHEEALRQLDESQNINLQRAKAGLRSPARTTPLSPLSPLFAGKAPRIDRTTSGPGMSVAEAGKTEQLEKQVQGLEKALNDADREMQEVVSRMNMAQMEVAELQSEKDEAMKQTRKLQAAISAEREKVKVLMEES